MRRGALARTRRAAAVAAQRRERSREVADPLSHAIRRRQPAAVKASVAAPPQPTARTARGSGRRAAETLEAIALDLLCESLLVCESVKADGG